MVEEKSKIAPDFIGDNPETMKEGTITPKPKDKPNVKIKIGDHEMEAEFREFKSGKKGYGAYGVFKINNWPCRLSLNLIEM
jgi:hypothetical protein